MLSAVKVYIHCIAPTPSVVQVGITLNTDMRWDGRRSQHSHFFLCLYMLPFTQSVRTLHRKLETNIPKNETVWSRPHFLYSNICERFIYYHDQSANFAVLRLWNDCGKYINPSQIHECSNWKRGSADSFLGIFFSNFRYSAFAVHVNRLTIGSISELGSSLPPCSWTQNVCGWNVQTGCCSGMRSIFIYVLKISDPDPSRGLTVPDPRICNPEL